MNGEPFRTLAWSAWLGWQIESNWANPWLFTLYIIVKPIAGSLMLVAMFFAADMAATAAGRGGVPPELLPFVYVSNACFSLVSSVMFGMSSVVTTDRDQYRMLKYIYISPARFQAYFLGRGLAKALEGIAAGAIIILAGMALPGIRSGVPLGSVQWGWLLAYLAVGFVMLWSAGMILAAAVLNLGRSASFLSEGVAGVVYFLSGVLFPLTILPRWLQAVGECLPTTYWIEGLRRTLIGPPQAIHIPNGSLLAPPFADWQHADLLAMLAATAAGLALAAQVIYRWSLRRAWHNGKLDEAQSM